MKKLLLLFIAALFIKGLSGQSICSLTLAPSPGHVKITNSQTINGTGTIYWLCSGISVIVNSSTGSTFILEQNVDLIINGSSGDAIFAKPGCTVTNNSSQSISVTSNTTNVTRINNASGNIVDIHCPSVTYEYTFVGGSACVGTTTSLDQLDLSYIRVGPNPVQRGEEIYLSGNNNSETEARISDLSGKTMWIEKGAIQSISTKSLKPGVYFLEFNSKGASVKYKIMVM